MIEYWISFSYLLINVAATSVVTVHVTSPCRASNVNFLDPTIINFPLEANDNLKMPPSKIQEGSHHHKFLSVSWPENDHVDVHPLPLPPRASSPAQLSMLHQVTEIQHSVKGRWQKGKLIGRGTFGSVFHATSLYAISFISSAGYSFTIICYKVCFSMITNVNYFL